MHHALFSHIATLSWNLQRLIFPHTHPELGHGRQGASIMALPNHLHHSILFLVGDRIPTLTSSASGRSRIRLLGQEYPRPIFQNGPQAFTQRQGELNMYLPKSSFTSCTSPTPATCHQACMQITQQFAYHLALSNLTSSSVHCAAASQPEVTSRRPIPSKVPGARRWNLKEHLGVTVLCPSKRFS